jgi:pimeloyl-ACP methyl ester carboxylesterase
MNLFRRVVRLVLVLASLLAGVIATMAAFFARQMIRPTRERLWAVPADAGLPYEDVEFPARDGLRLSGWFIPAADTPGPAVILVHGWPWNRLGSAADSLLANLSGALPVDFLRLAHALHGAGFHVLMFDLRNHGQSAEGGAVTFGLQEANDLLGALEYLAGRAEVSAAQIGVAGFSMGANTVLYALPHTERIAAAVAVQPTSPAVFADRYATDLVGPLGRPALALAQLVYEQASHLSLPAIEPVLAAAGAGDTPVLYVQGTGDRWGSVSNVAHMADQTPNAAPLFVETHHRYGGYRYVVDNPHVIIDFLRAQMP